MNPSYPDLTLTQQGREWVLSRLAQNAEAALADNDRGAANRALELIGKEQGMFIERKETGGPGDFANLGDAQEVFDLVRKELGDEMADALAGVLAKRVESEPDQPQLEPTIDPDASLN